MGGPMKNIWICCLLWVTCASGQNHLRVGFDIDDTVLYSRYIFEQSPRHSDGSLDYAWINRQDARLSIPIMPTLDLIRYFRAHHQEVFFITGRQPENGDSLAAYLSQLLGFSVIVNQNLFFAPHTIIDGRPVQGKAAVFTALGLDLYYGDADSDILAAYQAHIQPVRIVRHPSSVDQYAPNYFGNTRAEKTPSNPWGRAELERFLEVGVGPFGEPIYPLHWKGPGS
ncbi:MAG: hypothetical protein D6762_02895 [Candidatus Neomarinimicrobiota bacterium]|nr:MAG: hypothetical protein D6762_02895 [Candidatus Neomarinimicrobiota bacterium]